MPFGEGIQNSHPFKLKAGESTGKGSLDPSSQGSQAEGIPRRDTKGIGCHTQTPFLNPNFFNQWYGIKNVARVRINGESCIALPNNSTQINTIISCWKLFFWSKTPVRPSRQMSHLYWPGNSLTQPMGYVVIQVQVDGSRAMMKIK